MIFPLWLSKRFCFWHYVPQIFIFTFMFLCVFNEQPVQFSFNPYWIIIFLVAQGTLNNVLQHKLKMHLIFIHSVFLMVSSFHSHVLQLERPWVWRHISFAGPVMSVLFLLVYICHRLSSKKQTYIYLITTISNLMDFWVKENKVCFITFSTSLTPSFNCVGVRSWHNHGSFNIDYQIRFCMPDFQFLQKIT